MLGVIAALGTGVLWGTMYIPYRKAYLAGMNPLSFLTFFTVGELLTMMALAVGYTGAAVLWQELMSARSVLFWLMLGGFVWVIGDLFQLPRSTLASAAEFHSRTRINSGDCCGASWFSTNCRVETEPYIPRSSADRSSWDWVRWRLRYRQRANASIRRGEMQRSEKANDTALKKGTFAPAWRAGSSQEVGSAELLSTTF